MLLVLVELDREDVVVKGSLKAVRQTSIASERLRLFHRWSGQGYEPLTYCVTELVSSPARALDDRRESARLRTCESGCG